MSKLPLLPPRKADSHKGDFGRALLIGGARGMSGAAALSGVATLRSGAGLVQVATAASSQPVVASFEPSLMTLALPQDEAGYLAAAAHDALQASLAVATVVAIGPGLGRSSAATELVVRLYTTLPKPLVCDADALFALAERPEALATPGGVRILTPHPGEFQRLAKAVGRELPDLGQSTARAEWEDVARALAAQWSAVVILKGHRSLVTDGARSAHNTTGNPGMATGGSGDVLTGIITGLVAQGMKAYEAARLAAHVHGLAGDLAADDLGRVAMIASDLLIYLPDAWRAVGVN